MKIRQAILEGAAASLGLLLAACGESSGVQTVKNLNEQPYEKVQISGTPDGFIVLDKETGEINRYQFVYGPSGQPTVKLVFSELVDHLPRPDVLAMKEKLKAERAALEKKYDDDAKKQAQEKKATENK